MSRPNKRPSWLYPGSGSRRVPTAEEYDKDEAASAAADANRLQPLHTRRGNRPPPQSAVSRQSGPKRAIMTKKSGPSPPQASRKSALRDLSERSMTNPTNVEIDSPEVDGSVDSTITKRKQAVNTPRGYDETEIDGDMIMEPNKAATIRPELNSARVSSANPSKRVKFTLEGDDAARASGDDTVKKYTFTNLGEKQPSHPVRQSKVNFTRIRTPEPTSQTPSTIQNEQDEGEIWSSPELSRDWRSDASSEEEEEEETRPPVPQKQVAVKPKTPALRWPWPRQRSAAEEEREREQKRLELEARAQEEEEERQEEVRNRLASERDEDGDPFTAQDSGEAQQTGEDVTQRDQQDEVMQDPGDLASPKNDDPSVQPAAMQGYNASNAGEEPDLTRARAIFGRYFKSQVVQHALSLSPILASNEDKMWIMKRSLRPDNTEDWAAYKVRVEGEYRKRGLDCDAAFTLPSTGAARPADNEMDRELEGTQFDGVAEPADDEIERELEVTLEEESAARQQTAEVDLTLAREILGRFFVRPMVEHALSLDPAIALSKPRLEAMADAFKSTNARSWPAFKAAVEEEYAQRELSPDAAFGGDDMDVDDDLAASMAGRPGPLGYTDENWYVPTLKPDYSTGLPPLTIAINDDVDVTFDQIDAGSMPIARIVVGESIMAPVIQYAIHVAPGLASNEQKMLVLKQALTSAN